MLAWMRKMGNCLKSTTADDISLLTDSNTNNSNSVEQLEQPPPYVQVTLVFVVSTVVNTDTTLYQETNNTLSQVFYPSPNVSRPASQLTEEEQVKIAKRIGLIQHLPTGTFDGCKKNRE